VPKSQATKSGIPPSRVFGRPHFRDFLGSFVSPFRQHAAAVFRRHGLVVMFGRLISVRVSRTIAGDCVDASNSKSATSATTLIIVPDTVRRTSGR
jgi:hypothetical protein